MSSGWSSMNRHERGLTTLIDRFISPRRMSSALTLIVTSPVRSSSIDHIDAGSSFTDGVKSPLSPLRTGTSASHGRLSGVPRSASTMDTEMDSMSSGRPVSLMPFTKSTELCAIAKLTNSHTRTSIRT